MKSMVRKWPAIDILKLYSGRLDGFSDELVYKPQSFSEDFDAKIDASASFKALRAHDKWNFWLKRCEKNGDINELVKVRYGLQVGMDDLAKKGLNTPAISEMFVRWTRSIEKTARNIIKKKHKFSSVIAKDYAKAHQAKRRLEREFEDFLRKSSF